MCDHGFIGACAVCDGSGQQPEAANCERCQSPLLEDGSCDFCIPVPQEAVSGPPVGSWAHVAQIMAQVDDSGFDWDAWKDQMKDEEMGL